jgi:pyridoxamine 5'-phosphate oxidase
MQRVFDPLDERSLGSDPIVEFRIWFDAAREAAVPQHDAMTLATATSDGKPSARMVLLKQADREGFVFYSNYNSRKGRELAENPRAALVLYWAELNRSVRVEGAVARLTAAESDTYFASRPREGQLSSLTSVQSEPVGSRDDLDRRFEEMQRTFDGRPIPRPPHWGGYRLKPTRIEFWQQRFARLNDRVEYMRQPDGTWRKTRLDP